MSQDRVYAYAGPDKQPVACLFCSHDLFYDWEVLLNTSGMSLWNLDWANRSAVGLICAHCGFIMHFIEGSVSVTYAESGAG